MFYVMHVDRLCWDRVQELRENGRKKSDENEKFVHKTEMHFNSTFTPKWFDYLKAFLFENAPKKKNSSQTD